jgi:hypothetical protein
MGICQQQVRAPSIPGRLQPVLLRLHMPCCRKDGPSALAWLCRRCKWQQSAAVPRWQQSGAMQRDAPQAPQAGLQIPPLPQRGPYMRPVDTWRLQPVLLRLHMPCRRKNSLGRRVSGDSGRTWPPATQSGRAPQVVGPAAPWVAGRQQQRRHDAAVVVVVDAGRPASSQRRTLSGSTPRCSTAAPGTPASHCKTRTAGPPVPAPSPLRLKTWHCCESRPRHRVCPGRGTGGDRPQPPSPARPA